MLMQDFGSTILLCTPSYALNLAEVMAEEGVDPAGLKLKCGLFGAEPWTESMRGEIEKKLRISALDIYGLSEVIGPGVASECIEEKRGLHVFEDHFIAEIIDPATGKVLPCGETGELVFTTITKEAFPVIRYRTRDISRLSVSPCSCGRTHARMDRISGRTDDMLIIRGVNVFPSQIEEALLRVEGTAPHYLIEVARPGSLDEAVVKVEIRPRDFSDEMRQMVDLRDRIDHEIHSITGIRMKVELVAPHTLDRSEGKARRVLDHRKAAAP
jgi:phenylacetate-CoA ligase